ncbi:MAG: hypothetical protein AAF449_15345, partial [Myxococcota bacterium]
MIREDEPVRQACGTDVDCILTQYRGLNIDVVLFSTVHAEQLHYQLFETWTPSKINEGSLALRQLSGLIGLRQRVLQIFNPVLTPGGLLDQKPFRPRSVRGTDAPVLAATSPAKPQLFAAILAGIGLFFFLPLIFAAIAVKKRIRFHRWKSTWIGLFFFGAAALAATEVELRWALPDQGAGWLTGLGGGVAWSAFVLANIRLAAPALPGLDRVAHRDVFRLLRAWAVVCGLRCTFLAAYYLPFALFVRAMTETGPLPRSMVILLVFPAVGLAARAWLGAWIRALALFLDRRLVVGDADADNPWHREITRYLRGSLRRTGWSIDERRLETMIFLPGQFEGLRCYGGGADVTRVVIDEQTLTLGIGGYDAKSEANGID